MIPIFTIYEIVLKFQENLMGLGDALGNFRADELVTELTEISQVNNGLNL